MSNGVLADFVGVFNAETADWDGHRDGRVLLGRNQLVLAASEDERVSIPLGSVFDVNPAGATRTFEPVPGTSITVAFESGGDRAVAVVGGDDATIEKFVSVLFKAILNGAGVVVKHPAKRGGRVTDAPFRPGKLVLGSNEVAFETGAGTTRVELASVTDFGRETRAVDGDDRPTFVVRHRREGAALTTIAATESPRTLSILGRYLRQRYDELLSSLSDLSLGETEIETLVTLYSTNGDVSLAGVLGMEPPQVKQLLGSLHRQRLVHRTDGGPELTTRGQVVVNHYLERVNA